VKVHVQHEQQFGFKDSGKLYGYIYRMPAAEPKQAQSIAASGSQDSDLNSSVLLCFAHAPDPTRYAKSGVDTYEDSCQLATSPKTQQLATDTSRGCDTLAKQGLHTCGRPAQGGCAAPSLSMICRHLCVASP